MEGEGVSEPSSLQKSFLGISERMQSLSVVAMRKIRTIEHGAGIVGLSCQERLEDPVQTLLWSKATKQLTMVPKRATNAH